MRTRATMAQCDDWGMARGARNNGIRGIDGRGWVATVAEKDTAAAAQA